MTQPTEYEQVTYNSVEGAQICVTAADKVGFYGIAPIAQRAYSSAVHASSAQAVSASFGATQLATLQEIQKTFVALGIWATV
jgi:hypothetical protein